MKEDLISKLVETFKQETEKYSNSFDDVVNYKCEDFFKKNNPEKGYHSVDASIIFKNFTLKLEYKIDISMLMPKSTVEMRFMFENGKLPVEYSIYDLFNIIDNTNFKLYTFAYVTNETKMKEVLNYLVETFKEYKERIEELSNSIEQICILEKDIDEKINMLLDEKIFDSRDAFYLMHMLELYYVIDISRFTQESYLDYLAGRYKKSIKRYNKLGKKITKYEQRLVEYMKRGDVKEPITNTLDTFTDARKLKDAKIELLPMLLTWFILTPFWTIIYSLIFYIALHFISRGAIYTGGTDLFMIFMPSFITSIINSFFVRKIVYKMFFRKKYEKIMALDEIENGEKVINNMSKLFQFIIAIGIVISILSANTNIMFYEDSFKDNLEFLRIKGESYNYTDVDCVYKANGIRNDFGQVVNNPTYVIVLKGGKQINLYYTMEFNDIKENIIPIFENHNIEIKEIDLVDNIENLQE